ncbi:hypothetical protein HK099_001692 [Clydaea vesicula]|uniref:histidine kinase n=1 Tax=Clydaea vesicula TaxID=447962 RepID=A0AAD5U7R1_9FUNG|nr:hypothetical protein HK099_001692 [Clydaea vesicula]
MDSQTSNSDTANNLSVNPIDKVAEAINAATNPVESLAAAVNINIKSTEQLEQSIENSQKSVGQIGSRNIKISSNGAKPTFLIDPHQQTLTEDTNTSKKINADKENNSTLSSSNIALILENETIKNEVSGVNQKETTLNDCADSKVRARKTSTTAVKKSTATAEPVNTKNSAAVETLTSEESIKKSETIQKTTLPNPVAEEIVQTVVLNDSYSDDKEKRLADFVEKLGSGDGEKNEQKKKIDSLVKDLQAESQKVEEQILAGQNEIFHKNEEAFFRVEDEHETLSLKILHLEDLKALKAVKEQCVQDVVKRKEAKRFQRQQQREVKSLHNKTHEQEMAYKKIEEVKKKLAEHRERTEKLVDHIEERHLKQVKQFNACEARRIADQKLLVEIKCTHLSEEQKIAAVKENLSKISHQKALDKKKLDQIREQQRRELRHFKDRIDLETRMMEEFSNMHSQHAAEENEMINKHKNDYLTEKEKITATQVSIKVIKLQTENQIEITKLISLQKTQLRQLKRAQKNRQAKRFKHWSAIVQRDLTKKVGSGAQSLATSNFQSADGSQSSSVGSHSLPESKTLTRQGSEKNLKAVVPNKKLDLLGEEDEDETDESSLSLDTQHQKSEEKLQKMLSNLTELKKSQDEELDKLRRKIKEEQTAKEEEFQKLLTELDWQQDVNLKDLKKADEAEINEALLNQERELELERHIIGAEIKALMERKVLKNLLDTVVDGVISIDPRGYIQRFNSAAEKMFGYPSSYAIGKNIKELMPQHHRENHDDYLYKYLTTGVKKLIGLGKTLRGQRRDGTTFPIHISVTEVVDDGFHLFTAIVRDLTEMEAKEETKKAEDDCLPQMIWKTDPTGKAINLNKNFLNYSGVSEDKISTINVFSQELIHPEDFKRSSKVFSKALKDNKEFEVTRRIKGANGEFRWFLSRGTPMFDADNKIQFWCGSCTDIDKVENFKLELQQLPEAVPTIIWKVNTDGDVVFANKRLQDLTGVDYTKSPVNMFSTDIVHMDDADKSRSAFVQASKKKIFFETTRRLQGINGRYTWVLTMGSPVFNAEGDVAFFVGTCTDVSESKALQDEMLVLPESYPQMVWKSDAKGNVLFSNKKFTSYVGEENKVNIFSEAFVHSDDLRAGRDGLARALKEKGAFEIRRRLKSSEGSYKVHFTKATPALNNLGDVESWYGSDTVME